MQSNIDILYKFTHKPSDIHTLAQQKFTHTFILTHSLNHTHPNIRDICAHI